MLQWARGNPLEQEDAASCSSLLGVRAGARARPRPGGGQGEAKVKKYGKYKVYVTRQARQERGPGKRGMRRGKGGRPV